MSDRWSAFDLVEAYHLSQAVTALRNLGIFKTLKQPATADELSDQYSLDPDLLRGTLDYVAARTDLLRKSGAHFVATGNYSESARFLLELYLGAYGGNAAQLANLLRNPSRAATTVDRASHARAFSDVEASPLGALPEIIRQFHFNFLLDLGCGTGALLLDLAARDPAFVGWGIDLNQAMCQTARARIRTAGMNTQIRIRRGDCENLSATLTLKVRARVQVVTACQMANEMFGEGNARAIAWLRELRQVLPERILMIADYYGRLGKKKGQIRDEKNGRGLRETLLHDYAQLISGQGIPPATRGEWRSIYVQAGCRLLHIIEDTSTTRFIHMLRL